MMEADKRDFYAKAAKGLAASARLYNVDAVSINFVTVLLIRSFNDKQYNISRIYQLHQQ